MNVQAGDVAIIVKGRWPNVGRIVYVACSAGDRDYSRFGYGILPSWLCESLGADLDTDKGPGRDGYAPDIALRRLHGVTREQAERMKARADFDAALDDLALILAPFAETLDAPEHETQEVRSAQGA